MLREHWENTTLKEETYDEIFQMDYEPLTNWREGNSIPNTMGYTQFKRVDK
jgi:hypothetical protein